MRTLKQLREQVVKQSLFAPCGLKEAIQRLGFLQADPIRSPARAQDLILRHRVKQYSAGDLERKYPELELEESFLYAYGFCPADLWCILFPNTKTALTKAEQEALQFIAQHGPVHPKDFEAHVGGERKRNYWGGFSRTAKLTLEALHDRGALRVVRRDKGIRIYEVAECREQTLSNEERFEALILVALQSMGPTTRRFIHSELSHFRYLVETPQGRRNCLQRLVDVGRVRVDSVDSIEYLSLEGKRSRRSQPEGVRILAPFDPIVRDRARLEHLWHWTYRFEAYTPKAKRKLGYYAMPVLWRDEIVGWANASVEESRLTVDFGYVSGRPKEPEYREAAELEVSHLAKFLKLNADHWEASI